MKIFGKKGVDAGTMTLIVTLIIAVIGVYLWISSGSKSTGSLFGVVDTSILKVGNQLEDMGDCDNDKVSNKIDQCPCAHFQGSESVTYKGCPATFTEEDAKKDKTECGWYYTDSGYTPDCTSGENEKLCKKGSDGKYMTKCDEIKNKPIASLPGEAGVGKAEKSMGDLEIIEFKASKGGEVASSAKYGVITVDFEDAAALGKYFTLKIKNIGDEDIPNSFEVQYSICRNNLLRECKPVIFYYEGDSTSYSSRIIYGLKKGEEDYQKDFKIYLGNQGDYCDGASKCHLMAKVDSTNAISEKDGLGENNNVAYFEVNVRNQKEYQYDFYRYWYVEIFGDDGESNIPQPVYNFCSTDKSLCRVDGDCEGLCDTEDGDCNEYFADALPNREGCWVYASENDGTSTNGCATETAVQGAIIYSSSATAKIIDTNNDFVSVSDDGTQGNTLFKQKWYIPSKWGGSLICKGKNWYWCRTDDAGNYLDIPGKTKYLCNKEGQWEKAS